MKKSLFVPALCAFAAAASAQGALVQYEAVLNGANEAPNPVVTAGIGFAQVDIDTTAHTLRVRVTFENLNGNTTASHIHAATALPFTSTAGVATQTPSFSGFPLGVKSGAMDTTFDTTLTTSWNASYITANGGTPASAEAAFASALASGRAYLNIHSQTTLSGEIRGFLIPIPAPSAGGLLAVAGIAAARRRRK